jgi:hypothetical protein
VGLAVVVIPSAVLCNLIFLSSIATVRSTNTLRRGLWTFVAFLLFALGGFLVTTFAPIVLNAANLSASKRAVALATALAIVGGTVLTFLEYLVVGRGGRFWPRSDLEAVAEALPDSPQGDQS